MELNFIEGAGQWVSVGVITDERGDAAELVATGFASAALGESHGAWESTQEQSDGFVVRFEAH